jgi:hypothetical protein
MEAELRRLALRIKLYNVSGNVVHHAAILKKHMDAQGLRTEMIKGYCVIPQTKEACEHYWIRDVDSGLDFDIGFEVAKLRSPELQSLHPVLLESIPPGMIRSDAAETLILAENERLFELFQRDSKAFWHEAPRDVTNFRMKS